MTSVQRNVTELIGELYEREYRKIYATLVRLLNDWDLAESSASEAFAYALEAWATEGIPAKPVAWLISVAKFKAVDTIRRGSLLAKKSPEIALRTEEIQNLNEYQRNHEIKDDRLRLIFACCHPAIDPSVQVPLTLREVCGLSTEEIASAFLTSTTTMAQRIVRGKAKIKLAKIPIEIPSQEELAARLQSVLAVLYLVFNEGYAASHGERHLKHDLTEESIRLCRLVADELPDPEVHGLLALMLLQESRKEARIDDEGNIVLLEDQLRTKWDQELIREGILNINHAARFKQLGFFQVQALIASVHARSPSAETTDWKTITKFYDLLLYIRPSPVIELNRAVAVAMLDGPEAGLKLIYDLETTKELESYHLLYAAKGDLLRRAFRWKEAHQSFSKALPMVTQNAEKRFLEKRLKEVQSMLAAETIF